MAVTVQKGDSLWSIAQRELGDGSRAKEIARLNGIKNAKNLQPGTSLMMPGERKMTLPTPRPDRTQPDPGGGQFAGGNGMPEPGTDVLQGSHPGEASPLASVLKKLGAGMTSFGTMPDGVVQMAAMNSAEPADMRAPPTDYQQPTISPDPGAFGPQMRGLDAMQPAPEPPVHPNPAFQPHVAPPATGLGADIERLLNIAPTLEAPTASAPTPDPPVAAAPASPMGQAIPTDPVTNQPYNTPAAYLGVRGDAGAPQGVQVADASGAVPATKIVNFEGKRYTFPTDATDEEIFQFLDAESPSAGPPPAPPADPTAAATLDVMSAHPPKGPAPPVDFAREAKIGSQAGLSGIGHLLGAPLDLPTGIANLTVGGLNAATGGWPFYKKPVPLPFSPESPLGMDAPHLGDRIATGVGQIATMTGAPPIEQKDMSPGERIGYQTADFATQAAFQGALMALLGKLRGASDIPRSFDSFTKPYEAGAASPIIRDTVTGAGAGTGLGLYNEAVPEDQRGILGTIASMLAGGVGGGMLKDIATGVPMKLFQTLSNFMPSKIPYDKFGRPTLNKTADDAAKFVQDAAGGRQAASDAGQSLDAERALAELEGRPVPPLGQATQNLGLARAERGVMNTGDGLPVTQRNLDTNRWMGDQIQGIGPGVDPSILPAAAERVGQEQLGAAKSGVNAAQSAADAEAARQAAEATQLQQRYNNPGGAAQRVDQAVVEQGLRPVTDQSNAMYNAVDPHGAAMVPTDNLIAEAQAVRDTLGALNTPNKVIPQGLLARIDRTQPVATPSGQLDANGQPIMNPPGPAQTSVRSLVAVVPEIGNTITRAVKAGNYQLADNLRALRARIGETIDTAAASGDPEAQAAVAARENYAQTVAPIYNRGPGDEATKLRKDFNLDRQNRTETPPSQTAGRFIQAGQPEKLQSLQRAGGAPAMAGARDIIVGNAVHGGLVRDGRLNGQALGKFMRDWGSVIDTDPALRQEFNQLEGQVRRGETASGALADQLTRAQGHMQFTEEDLGASALATVAGKNPENAITAIAQSGDPAKAMADLERRVRSVPGASDALKQATTDWLYNKVTNTGREGDLPLSYAKLVKEAENSGHRNMLAAAGFNPADMAAMERVRRTADLRKILDDAKGAAGSPTAANFDEQMRLLEAGMRGWFGGFRGGNMARNIKVLLKLKDDKGNERIRQLVSRAMVDPRVAKILLDRKVMDAPSEWGSKIAKLMRWEEVAHRMNNDQQK